jgi:hypothetical protein
MTVHNLLTLIWWLWRSLGTHSSCVFRCYSVDADGVGERGRNRTFNLLIKSQSVSFDHQWLRLLKRPHKFCFRRQLLCAALGPKSCAVASTPELLGAQLLRFLAGCVDLEANASIYKLCSDAALLCFRAAPKALRTSCTSRLRP